VGAELRQHDDEGVPADIVVMILAPWKELGQGVQSDL
jgi:hypothetical protein